MKKQKQEIETYKQQIKYLEQQLKVYSKQEVKSEQLINQIPHQNEKNENKNKRARL